MADTPNLPPAPGAAFTEFLKAGQIRLQVCTACERQIFYPRTICPHCGGAKLEWRQPSGRGTVYSTTTVRQKPERGGDYNVAIIDLAEGARMMSRVEGVAPAEVRIGMAVQAEIAQVNNEPLLVFRATGGR
jgi:uncharacterized OB-fold protein